MDYYKILGVSEDAEKSEIKNAYRKLSLRHHPDKPTGNEEEFKKINEAYQVLSDPRKKGEYDMRKNNPFMGGDGLFKMFFGGGMPGMGMMSGVSPEMVPNFQEIFSGGFPPNVRVHMNRGRNIFSKAIPIIKTIEITLEQSYTGIKLPLEVERWIQEGSHRRIEKERIYVSIPQGIDDDEIIILRGRGNIINESNKGDIKLFIKVKNETMFKRQGLNLIYKKTISLKESLIGFVFDMKFINGKVFTIKNAKGCIVKPGYKKIIPRMGIKRENTTGDLHIYFDVEFPSVLTETQMKKLEQIL